MRAACLTTDAGAIQVRSFFIPFLLYICTHLFNAYSSSYVSIDGTPRNCLFVTEQIEDYRSVVKWVKERPEEFDVQKIVLWGTSFSGTYICQQVSLCQYIRFD